MRTRRRGASTTRGGGGRRRIRGRRSGRRASTPGSPSTRRPGDDAVDDRDVRVQPLAREGAEDVAAVDDRSACSSPRATASRLDSVAVAPTISSAGPCPRCAGTTCVPVSPASARSTFSGSVMIAVPPPRSRKPIDGLDLRRHAARRRSACPRRGTASPRRASSGRSSAPVGRAEVERDLLDRGRDDEQLGADARREQRAREVLVDHGRHADQVAVGVARRPGCRRRRP